MLLKPTNKTIILFREILIKYFIKNLFFIVFRLNLICGIINNQKIVDKDIFFVILL
jgi:hypothetical protein